MGLLRTCSDVRFGHTAAARRGTDASSGSRPRHSIERPQPLLEDAHVVGPPALSDDVARGVRDSAQLLDLGTGGVQLGTLSLP